MFAIKITIYLVVHSQGHDRIYLSCTNADGGGVICHPLLQDPIEGIDYPFHLSWADIKPIAWSNVALLEEGPFPALYHEEFGAILLDSWDLLGFIKPFGEGKMFQVDFFAGGRCSVRAFVGGYR